MSATIAVTIDEAAAMAGVSRSVIKRALSTGDLIARYPSTRPVIFVDEIRAWLEACPTESRLSRH
jgi:predicted DNA-binding transcriptional regulator AlpA